MNAQQVDQDDLHSDLCILTGSMYAGYHPIQSDDFNSFRNESRTSA